MPSIRRFGILLWLLLAALPIAAGDEPAAATAETPAPSSAPPETPDAPGQDALNEAIDAKLAVDELDDYARVLDLCRKALDQGLDVESRKFAEDLYTGTLIDRAGMLTEVIFRPGRPDQQWQRIRAFAMRDLEEVVGRDPKIGGAHLMIARLQALPGGDRGKAAQAAAKEQGGRVDPLLIAAGMENHPSVVRPTVASDFPYFEGPGLEKMHWPHGERLLSRLRSEGMPPPPPLLLSH